jgi:hypothetical protein
MVTIHGNEYRRIELRGGRCAADDKSCEVLVSMIAPNMHRVYVFAGIAGDRREGVEKTHAIVSLAAATKLANGLRDAQLRKGFHLLRDWTQGRAREILPPPLPPSRVKVTARELAAGSRALLRSLI